MRRRDLLKIAATAPFVSLLPRRVASARAQDFTQRRVRPSDPAWPSAERWNDLREAVGGQLIAVESLLAPCRAFSIGGCFTALTNMRNPFALGDHPAGTQVSGWLNAWTPQPSIFALRARNATDVAAAVRFAREHRLRLVVKGGGHSYQGTSNAPDSLLVWTRAMNAVTVHDAFVATGCAGTQPPTTAVTVEAGAMWIDAYDAVTTRAGRYVQGGGCATVGVAGLIQSGGFGSFSKRFGTAAGGLLEAEIVTADGIVRTVNACTEPDLFWALKGGGGGSFGVVTKVTLRTHELPGLFGYVGARITAKSDAAFLELIARFLEFYGHSLLDPHWGESVKLTPDNALVVSMVWQGLDEQRARDVWRPFLDWVQSADHGLDDLLTMTVPARTWWSPTEHEARGTGGMVRDTRDGAPAHHAWWSANQDEVSGFLYGYESVWLPVSLLEPSERQRLTDALFAASRSCDVQLHFNKGLAGAPAAAIEAARDSATNPAVLDAFALAIVASGGVPGVSSLPYFSGVAQRQARAVDEATTELRRVAPAGGSYVSESNYFNASWQSAFWGPHYPKLRTVKDTYDPDGLFFVHHGVGSEDWSADGFERVARR